MTGCLECAESHSGLKTLSLQDKGKRSNRNGGTCGRCLNTISPPPFPPSIKNAHTHALHHEELMSDMQEQRQRQTTYSQCLDPRATTTRCAPCHEVEHTCKDEATVIMRLKKTDNAPPNSHDPIIAQSVSSGNASGEFNAGRKQGTFTMGSETATGRDVAHVAVRRKQNRHIHDTNVS